MIWHAVNDIFISYTDWQFDEVFGQNEKNDKC